MQRHIMNLWVVATILASSGGLPADEKKPAADTKPVDGTLLVDERTYQLTKIVAYESNLDDEESIVVVASDRTISLDKIKAALKEKKTINLLGLRQPFIAVGFNKQGEAKSCSGYADNASFGANRFQTGELTVEKGRVRGKAGLPKQKGAFEYAFDFAFDVPLGLEPGAKPAARKAGPVKPTVSGTFKGNGKGAKLAYVSAQPDEPFGDQPAIRLIFTEKDHSKEKKPHITASFGNFGSALLISLHEDGSIFGCQVVHAAHEKQGFSSLGSIKTDAFEVEEGRVSGKITTDGEVNTFDQTWEVDIQFEAPIAGPAKKPVAADKPSAKKPGDKPDTPKPGAKPKPDKELADLKARDIPVPKDATDLKYDDFTEHITFKSAKGIQALAKELKQKLDEQDWESDGVDVVTAQTAVIMRKRGDAELNIIITLAGKGSEVRIITDGLEWEEDEEE